ncbi:MAG: hemagglutinin repeat-containing protein, partial [Corticimicrobacter sp.]|uniref:hemagglutinin repeat-containing protein n=1 Tax=Corticimicrobacter sp. TaxID=2678536 RepID=UPI0032DA9F50
RMYGDQVGITTGDLRNATGAVLAARQGMTLGVASLTNDGAVEAGRDLKLDVAGKLSNTGGLSAAGRIEVDAGRVENRGTLAAGLQDDGSLGAEGDLQIRTAAVSNSGILLAGGDASVVADTIDLSGGKLVAGQALTLQTEGELRNVRGAAHGATVSVQADRLDNAAGRIGSDGALVVVTNGPVSNVAGTLAAGDRLDVQASALDNTDGVVSGEGVSIRVNETITNVRGVVQSGQQLDLSGAGLLDNRNGRVLSDSGRIEAGSLDNRSGIVQAEGALQLISAGEVNNQRGELYGGALSVTAAGLDNSAGRLIGTESLDLIARQRIDNTDGTLAAGGRLDVQTGVLGNVRGRIEAQAMALEVDGALDNRNGLILADNGLRIRAASIDNRDTLNASAKGVMGGAVDLAADAIDNRAGRIGASQSLEIVTASLDNIRGQVASNGRARIEATRLGNDTGLISAGTALTLATDRIDNQGRLHSGGDLTLDVRSLTNRASGEIVAAGVNRLNVLGVLENQGLIDGGHTRIQAATVNNTGRLYGDRISIGAGELRNEPGAVIASRGDMDLGIGTLTNRERALIFADGDLAIGGALDAASRAAGSARSLINASATIEATGHADIAAASIRNLNNHFESEVVEISREPKLYYRLANSTELMDGSKMWLCDQVTAGCGRDPVTFLDDDDERRLLLPSERYPESQYGPPFDYVPNKKGKAGRTAPIPPAYVPATTACSFGGDDGGSCYTVPERFAYAANQAVWSVFEMDYPGPEPVLPPPPIAECGRIGLANCQAEKDRQATYKSQMDAYRAQQMELDGRIRAFNADFNSRLVANFFYYKVEEVVSESRTVSTDPGKIIAGGNAHLNGEVFNDKSSIVAGGTLSVDGPAIVNHGAEGQRIVQRQGYEVRTVVADSGRDERWTVYDDIVAPERIELAAASVSQHAIAPASGQNVPGVSNIAGASTSSSSTGANVPGAQSVQVSGGPLAASIAKGIDTQGGQPVHGVTGPLEFAATSQAGVPGVEKGQSGGLRAAALARGIGTQGSGAASGVADPMVPATSSDGSLQASAVATGIGMSGVQPGPRAPAVVIDISASGAQTVRVVTLQPQVPQNAMYSVVQRPDTPYLIATDAQFTGQRQSVSSDFMLQQLNQDPEHILKRLGDGFYEQRLVAEQVMLATGQRFVGDYTDNESQYKALLGAGVDFAHKLGLNVGTALTDEQLRHMTSDMVWLVEQTVTLPDGTQQQVLAPQVYLAVKPGDLRGDGTLIAGRDTSIRVDGDAVNTGTVGARNAVVVEAGNIRNTVGSVQGRTVNLAAREDIDNLAGLIRGDTVTLAAGRDVNLQASTRSQASGGVSSTRLDGVARIDAGTLNVQAGQDFNAEAAAISVAESARIQAGRDINLTTAEERYAESYNYSSKNRAEMRSATDIGTRIEAGADLTLIAGRDVAAIAAEVAAGGRLAVGAERDITVAAGDQSGYAYNETYYKKSGFLSSKSEHTIVSSDWTDSVSSTFTGDSAVLMAGRDLLVAGSNVAAQHDLIMSADRNVAVTAAANSLEEYEYRRVKKSGFGALGGISYGSRRTTDSLDTQRGLHTGSTLGSVEGDVLVNAGASLGVLGSDILASKGDITLVGRDVTVAGLADTMRQREFHEVKQSGLTVTASNPVVDAMQTGMRMADAAGKVDNPVMQGLAGATTVLAASNAYDAVNAARNAANPGALSQIGGVSIKISLGSSQSSSTTDRSMTSNTGANVAAGRDLTVLARGAGEASDITVQGANLSAGRDAVLKAEGDIQLQAARNVFDQHTDSKSSGASIGIAFSYGGEKNGLSFELGANAARGRQDGRDVTWSNAHVAAGNTLALQSGGDISLQGASAKADRIIASAGGNLLLASLQEISEYTSRQRSGGIGVSICVPPLCAGASSAWANASTGRMDSDFESVTKQTGLWAGDGGFQIDVGGRTSLTGSVIASSDQAIAEGRNRLSTGTLETGDIRNKASYSASQVSVGGGFGFGGGAEGAGSSADLGTTRGNQVAGGASKDVGTSLAGQGGGLTMGAPTVVAASGSGSSTTRSAISEGEIEIRDEAGQQALTGQTGAETIAALDRDTSDTLNALRPIFDKEKIEAGFEIAGEASRQVGQFLTNRAREADAEVKNLEQQLAQERSRQPGPQDGQR